MSYSRHVDILKLPALQARPAAGPSPSTSILCLLAIASKLRLEPSIRLSPSPFISPIFTMAATSMTLAAGARPVLARQQTRRAAQAGVSGVRPAAGLAR